MSRAAQEVARVAKELRENSEKGAKAARKSAPKASKPEENTTPPVESEETGTETSQPEVSSESHDAQGAEEPPPAQEPSTQGEPTVAKAKKAKTAKKKAVKGEKIAKPRSGVRGEISGALKSVEAAGETFIRFNFETGSVNMRATTNVVGKRDKVLSALKSLLRG